MQINGKSKSIWYLLFWIILTTGYTQFKYLFIIYIHTRYCIKVFAIRKEIHLERNISCQYCNSANWKIIDVQIRCV